MGRLWYEMRKGDTKLKIQCRYMVRRPTEIFLKEGEPLPKDPAEGQDDLSQQELLKLPDHIPHRSKTDPRELKILDPACGSGHFLLYCFDLLLTIYEEAYADPELGQILKQDYPTLDALKRDVPRLILANNLHGIDIDLRASQIAALALWLRCQRAYQEMGLKKDRPKITRSNFVCAEPMPGEPAMLKEFVGQLEPRLLGQLVEVVFNKMKLAGEAGSLLKIEEDIRTAVATAKQQWEAGPVEVQRTLFDRSEPKLKQKRFNLSGVTDEEFFNEAEYKVVQALRSYAERATNGHKLQRRLFTEDAVRGFAFVDLCHKRFDVVLMNPPYGDFAEHTLAFAKSVYQGFSGNIYGAFLRRCVDLSVSFIGALTSRTFLTLSQFGHVRELILGPELSPFAIADLGAGVLDDAAVETCASVFQRTSVPHDRTCAFVRVDDTDRGTQLLKQTRSLTEGGFSKCTYLRSESTFRQLPGMRMLYSAPQHVIDLFKSGADLENAFAEVRPGLCSGDDFRFTCLWWEPAMSCDQRDRWKPFAKGGDYERYFADLHFLIDWEDEGQKIKQYAIEAVGSVSKWIFNEKYYFRPGITFPNSSAIGFSARCLPADSIISVKGQGVFPIRKHDIPFCLALLNSSLSHAFLCILNPGKDVQAGDIKILPFGAPRADVTLQVVPLVEEIVGLIRDIHACDETSPVFWQPCIDVTAVNAADGSTALTEYSKSFFESATRIQQVEEQLDKMVYSAYGLSPDEVRDFVGEVSSRPNAAAFLSHALGDLFSPKAGAQVWLSYSVGCAFGRWDVRCVDGSKNVNVKCDPLGRLQVRSPGMLQPLGSDAVAYVSEDYPFQHDLDGILVDDADHTDDIVSRVRGVLEVIWKSRSEAIEREASNIVGVKDLREYFRKTTKGGFWDDHISRYSKSRRKAPIYWLLQSSKKSYAIWLYYHRLDKDLLFKALVNYVEPKIRLEGSRLDSLRSQKAAAGDTGKAAKKIDKEIEKQEDFISELQDFEDKLRRAANLHLEPDLNDGVVLNIAPLHELVPWKEAKKYWDDLLAGEYEWSSIGKQLREKGIVPC